MKSVELARKLIPETERMERVQCRICGHFASERPTTECKGKGCEGRKRQLKGKHESLKGGWGWQRKFAVVSNERSKGKKRKGCGKAAECGGKGRCGIYRQRRWLGEGGARRGGLAQNHVRGLGPRRIAGHRAVLVQEAAPSEAVWAVAQVSMARSTVAGESVSAHVGGTVRGQDDQQSVNFVERQVSNWRPVNGGRWRPCSRRPTPGSPS